MFGPFPRNLLPKPATECTEIVGLQACHSKTHTILFTRETFFGTSCTCSLTFHSLFSAELMFLDNICCLGAARSRQAPRRGSAAPAPWHVPATRSDAHPSVGTPGRMAAWASTRVTMQDSGQVGLVQGRWVPVGFRAQRVPAHERRRRTSRVTRNKR